MPVVAKCTAFFGSDAGRGWSESHALSLSTPVGDLLPVLQSFKALMDNLRRPLLGKDRYLKGLRVSYPTATGSIASSSYRYTPYMYPGGSREGCAPSAAAMCRMGDVTNQLFSNLFLRGFWDDVEKNEQLDFTTSAGSAWKILLDQFIAGLTGGQYGWAAQDEPNVGRGIIDSYTSDVNGFVTFTITFNSGLVPANDSIIPFRAARLNGSNSPLNTTMIVRQLTPTTVRTVRPIAAGPFVSSGTFVMNATNFVRYTGMQYAILARKPEGKPFLQSPARRKAKARF